MRKTLTTLAIAAAVAASTLGFTASSASAHWKGHIFIGVGLGGQQVCHQELRSYVWYDKSGNKHFSQKWVPICYWSSWGY